MKTFALAALGQEGALARQRRAAGEGLETVDLAAAAALTGAVDDLHVADVAGAALGTAVDAAVAHDARADARAHLHEDEVVVTLSKTVA